jgi:cardiolipin synthase
MSLEAGWVGVAGPYPVRDGNNICPLIDGEPAFRRICALIDTAKRTVWVTITFMWADFRMPDGRGTALDVLQRAAERGVDVRILFWRPDDETAHLRRNAFWGSLEQRRQLQSCAPDIKCRWDRSHPGFCQHQKSWLIDEETAFVGGINLNPHSMVKPGHDGEGQNHDIYVELAGPSVADVTHNFVQRWNEASDRNESDGRFGSGSETELAIPQKTPPAQGSAQVQIQRTCPPGRIMSDGSDGEKGIFAQYIAAINAAREAIYIENQYIEVLEIVVALTAALQRGVAVLWLAPAEPDHRPNAYDASDRSTFFAARAALGSYDGFMLSGIAGLGEDGRRKPVYVHAKLMIVDDVWATVGSANLHRFSLFGNSEMNVSFHDPAVAKQLRVDLFREHLGLDTADLAARPAFDLFRQIATRNRCLLAKGCADWQGLAFTLNVNTYGKAKQI